MSALGLRLTPKRLAVWRTAAQHSFFGVVPVVFTVYMWHFAVSHHAFAVDFHNAFWVAGHRVLSGLTPYVGPHTAVANEGIAFVYPALGALFFAVLALIPHGVADVVFTLTCMAAVLASLFALGIRDWRLYGLGLLWPAVISGWQTANVSLLLVLGVALAWRFMDRPRVVGCLVAVLVSLKLFLWPVLLWLLATRRLAAAGWAIVVGAVANAAAWAVLGFNQFGAYIQLARAVTRVEEANAYTPLALALRLGTSRPLAYIIGCVIAGLGALALVRAGRRGRDSSAFLLAIVLGLIATPTVWRHYFALLLVPLAIARPRVTGVWMLPLALFFCPVTSPLLWQLILALVVLAVVALALLREPAGTNKVESAAATTIRSRSQALQGAWRHALLPSASTTARVRT
jgi:hypothetical protein